MYHCGDRLNIKADHPDLLRQLEAECALAEELMNAGATRRRAAFDLFWAAVTESYPDFGAMVWTLNQETGECIALSSREFLQAYRNKQEEDG